ncbi:hypothetical protein L3V82_12700 [Thiotrichales bacterium 19S3-7]|nr:hypothetical protein [Thiotrichales bacterium 19S3-7]MCF6803033.1 hypothetical protein [Thiotrichales bacterium 19S3-11]
MTNVITYSQDDLNHIKTLITESGFLLYRINEDQTSDYIKSQFAKDLYRQGQVINSENKQLSAYYEYYMTQLLDIKIMFSAMIKIDDENPDKIINRDTHIPEETYINLSECKKQFAVSNKYGDKITINFDLANGVTVHSNNPTLLSNNNITILQLFEQALLAYPDHKLLTEIKKSQSQLIEQISNELEDNAIKLLNDKVFQLENLCKDILESDKSITAIKDEFNEIMQTNVSKFPFYQSIINLTSLVNIFTYN